MSWMLAVGLAWGQDELTFDAVRVVEHGKELPRVVFHPTAAGGLGAEVRCGERVWSVQRAVKAGESFELKLEGIAEGEHDCKLQVRFQGDAGTEGVSEVAFQVASLRPVRIDFQPSDYDRVAGKVLIRVDRTVGEAVATVYGPGGVVIDEVRASSEDQRTLLFDWQDKGQEVLRVDIAVTDGWGSRTRLELRPWFYAIPHDDVVFASGSAEIVEAEVGKLERSWAEVVRVLGLYGSTIPIRLYVAGYTDTVGDGSSNLGLSERRARSLAAWFHSRGFPGEVWFQGFGEEALALPTGDGVDAAANRRALYLMAAEPPPTSRDLPRAAWKKL